MKSISKRTLFLMTIIITLSFLFIVSMAVSAADPVKLSASTEEGITGKEVTVTVSIANAKDTEGGQFDLAFNTAKLEPKKDAADKYMIKEGKFVSDASSSLFMTNVVGNKVKVAWITPEGNTAASGVVCTIVFKLLDDGVTDLTFSDVVIAPEGVAVSATHSAGKVTVISVADAKKAAIDAAIAAIAALPAPADIELTDKAAVEAARALVETAKDDHGAVDADITNLAKLVDAEKMIAKLEAIKAACDAVMVLPDLNKLTLDDKPAVVAARALVNKVKTDHGAVDADFVCLPKLTASENRIKELEGLKQTPPTGGMHYQLLSGLLIFGGGTLALIKRRNRVIR